MPRQYPGGRRWASQAMHRSIHGPFMGGSYKLSAVSQRERGWSGRSSLVRCR
ncbi:hypothetical protein ACFWFU_14845 [Streptomyces sp. NPDC060235]|uniref:hypothetical protein n=1 Tax=Streptomyces sp. NPDC060235 TaxID=3347080 RepID=UPI00364F8E17